MNEYVGLIKQALNEIFCESCQVQPIDLDEEKVVKIIYTVDLAIKLIRINSSISGYLDFVREITKGINGNKNISKMVDSIRDYRELKI
jgi:hypothetical protein